MNNSAETHMQSGKCSKERNARGGREIAFAAIFISQTICRMFHFKEKQTTFCIIIRRMTIEKGARAAGILRQGAGIIIIIMSLCHEEHTVSIYTNLP